MSEPSRLSTRACRNAAAAARLAMLLLGAAALGGCEPASQPAHDAAADQPAWSGPREEEPTGKLDRSFAGRPAPNAAFEDPEGQPASLAEFRGKPVLVNLWATWCAPCVAEMPTLDALAGREGERLAVLTISQDLDGREKVEAFFERQRYRNLETWLDPEMKLMAELKVNTLPTTILYDSKGREVWRVSGLEDWTSERARALLAEAPNS